MPKDVYTDPKYPVHVVTGAAGNRELINSFENPKPEWSAVRLEEYSFTTMNVTVDQMVITQWNDSATNPAIIDQFTIKKSKPTVWERIEAAFIFYMRYFL